MAFKTAENDLGGFFMFTNAGFVALQTYERIVFNGLLSPC
jgi:hypothetical protein